jgi:hypothetical protein
MDGYEDAIRQYGEALGLDMNTEENFSFVADNIDLIQAAA